MGALRIAGHFESRSRAGHKSGRVAGLVHRKILKQVARATRKLGAKGRARLSWKKKGYESAAAHGGEVVVDQIGEVSPSQRHGAYCKLAFTFPV
jgi:hypothetical protein